MAEMIDCQGKYSDHKKRPDQKDLAKEEDICKTINSRGCPQVRVRPDATTGIAKVCNLD